MEVLVGTFNKEMALVGAFFGLCETSRRSVDSTVLHGGEVLLRHLLARRDVLVRNDHDGVAGEVFVHVVVAAVVEEAEGREQACVDIRDEYPGRWCGPSTDRAPRRGSCCRSPWAGCPTGPWPR